MAPRITDKHLVSLTWDQLKYSVRVKDDQGAPYWKDLLNSVSGTARKGRVLAIMGPSGAGKSTLLNAISGQLALGDTMKLTGTAFLDEMLFMSKYKPLISYVAQDDIVMGKDTPREAINFSYRLRCGASAEEAETAVAEIIEKLSLDKCADTLLGVPGLIKGVSGGEKKRTNIGSELITNPLVLLLDEPTTGLDSVNALRVGQLLKDLAKQDGRTVICTIHTPSSELYDVFDDVLLLAAGSVVYHGPPEEAPAYFAAAGYPCPRRVNPSEFFMKLLQLPTDEIAKLHAGWLGFCETDTENKSVNQTPDASRVTFANPHLDELVSKSSVGCMTELGLLTKRSIRNTMRDRAATIGRLVRVLFLAIIMALFYINLASDDSGVQDRLGVLFMVTMNLVFSNVISSIATFPPERAVFLNEQTSGMYGAVNYYISKCIAEFPLLLVFPTLYLVIVYWAFGLAPGTAAFFSCLAVAQAVSHCGNAFGLFAAALFPKPEVAMSLTPLMIMPMLVVAGLFANTERLEPYWVWLNYISFPRYAYKGFTVNEFTHITGLCPDGGTCRFRSGQEVIKFLGFDKETDAVWFNCMMICILMLVLRVFGALVLAVQGANRRSKLVFERNWKNGGKAIKVNAQLGPTDDGRYGAYRLH